MSLFILDALCVGIKQGHEVALNRVSDDRCESRTLAR